MELLTIMAGVGLIVGALSITGLSGTLVNDLLYLAGDSPLTLLLMGAFCSFILGIGMTVTAAYVFLAIVLAPALIQGGLEPMSVHLFILYWGMLSFHNTTCCPGCVRCSKYRWLLGSRDWLQSNAIRSVIYFIPFFCARTSTYSIGNLVGNYFCCCQGRCGHNPDSWLIAKLSLWNRTR